ncbi:obtusifoliol 14-alpha demethylase [Lolium perenne]|uniref:obtusifoliol 14-alpha demethylase n=1 Tax=Lolium perenne TaxID=4522 RepID=UPI0021F57A85|nr:obtusifoliol 14-alpha demethylase [Lolium perenne]
MWDRATMCAASSSSPAHLHPPSFCSAPGKPHCSPPLLPGAPPPYINPTSPTTPHSPPRSRSPLPTSPAARPAASVPTPPSPETTKLPAVPRMDLLAGATQPQWLLAGGALLLATLAFLRALLGAGAGKRAPPTIPAAPVVGGLLRFLRGPIPLIRAEYARLGPVFTVPILTRRITFLIGPEVSGHFFKGNEAEMSQQEVYRFNVPTFGPGVVFDVDYLVRQEQFRFFTEALKSTKLRSYVDMMVAEAEEYFSKWGESGTVDLKYELEHLIILTASRCLLGREVREKLFDDVSALFHDLDNGMIPISVIFPYLPIPAHRKRDQARARLAEIFSTIIKSRKASGQSEEDMLQCFIDSKYKNGRSTTETEVTGLLIAALFAGQHTSSITSTWTGAYLLKFQQYFAEAVEEQKRVMKRHGDKIDHDILAEMDVLYRCIKEALRLHPPLIMLLRQSHIDFSVTTREGKEYDIPKGHIVATSPAFANRLPHIFKNPDSYDPDRFAPGREEDKAAGAFSYIAFGGGRHGCLGEPFAYLQIKAIWTHLLRNFEFELVSPFPESDWNAMVVGIKDKVMVNYKRRKLVVDN